MAAEPRTLLSHEEYFALERESNVKHEYVAGQIIAMVGGSPTHGVITVNASTTLNMQLRAKSCLVYSSDVRIAIRQADSYMYPDVSVVCGDHQFDGRNSGLLNPIVIIEVLSPSTAEYDHGQKFMRYQRLTSLRNYILIAQDAPFILCFSRDERGLWVWPAAEGLDTSLALTSIECELALAEVYAKVDFGRATG